MILDNFYKAQIQNILYNYGWPYYLKVSFKSKPLIQFNHDIVLSSQAVLKKHYVTFIVVFTVVLEDFIQIVDGIATANLFVLYISLAEHWTKIT